MSRISTIAVAPRIHEQAIAVALDLLDAGQSKTPRIAEVAKRMGVPRGNLDTLFPDDKALLIAATEQALVVLIDRCTRAVVTADPADPMAQIEVNACTFLDWTAENPAAFRLLFTPQLLSAYDEPSLQRYLLSLRDLAQRLLARAAEAGQIAPQMDSDATLMALRSHLVGIGLMLANGQLARWSPGQDPVEIARSLIRDYIDGLKSRR